MPPFTEIENKRGRTEFGGKMRVKLDWLTGHPSGNGYMAQERGLGLQCGFMTHQYKESN